MKKILYMAMVMLIVSNLDCSAQQRLNVAVFVHEGVQLVDFSGPAEVFSDAHFENGNAAFNVYTVAAKPDQIKSQGFLNITPNYSFDNCPKPDIIVLPGGATNIPLQDPKVISWIKSSEQTVTYYLSVCTGAMLLAKAGLLDGKKATTHYCCQDGLASDYPKVEVLKGVRYVDNGKLITTEGISAGIDGALYLVQKICGKTSAEKTAKYMMYDWRPESYKVVIVP